MKYLGVDWGEKRIGLAIGEDEVKLASPFKVANDFRELVKIIKSEEIEVVVIGVPYSISDVTHKLPQRFADFLESLKQAIDIPIKEVDERLSSKAGDARIGDKKTKASRDEIAAMEILQSYFDSI
ncbi:Holliday junction resolvase RuvX [Candidatus Parcubacteria bacterium]|nr:Holliday junction resolvase RuvX [Patescibacteria group bacterium]MBU4309375.1 Holliday junction resolvase RuvX [Patescibacteria group bacterium]MBU4432096.1 Holliday junction resolvase RuvX [Patescibacteria group bacterium]MBU4577736.1 Holliday junction resolvase RuvX [Patescibacteria group bacterium]MCG2697421.1 Holliday junction resolvase RuvX [Candidatus Parcubacteria bacterium]